MDELNEKLTLDTLTKMIVDIHKKPAKFDKRIIKMALQAAAMIGGEQLLKAERKRCHEIVQRHQIRNGFHINLDGDKIGQFNMNMLALILSGAASGMSEPAKTTDSHG